MMMDIDWDIPFFFGFGAELLASVGFSMRKV